MFVFEQTQEFSRWLTRLKDPQGKTRVLARIRAAQLGRFDDCAPAGGGVHEMRIHRGPGVGPATGCTFHGEANGSTCC